MSQGDNHEDGGGRPIIGQALGSHSPNEFTQEQDKDIAQEQDGVMLDPKVQAQLGRVFRAYCDDLIHQPIPHKFSVLLAQLEAKQRAKK